MLATTLPYILDLTWLFLYLSLVLLSSVGLFHIYMPPHPDELQEIATSRIKHSFKVFELHSVILLYFPGLFPMLVYIPLPYTLLSCPLTVSGILSIYMTSLAVSWLCWISTRGSPLHSLIIQIHVRNFLFVHFILMYVLWALPRLF